MASIYIESARIVYGPGHVECQCSLPVTTLLGEAAVTQWIALVESQSLPSADWTDDDLCAAVAAVLQVDPVEVAVRQPVAP